MNNELKIIVKILEDNKRQINTQSIHLKSIQSNVTTDTQAINKIKPALT